MLNQFQVTVPCIEFDTRVLSSVGRNNLEFCGNLGNMLYEKTFKLMSMSSITLLYYTTFLLQTVSIGNVPYSTSLNISSLYSPAKKISTPIF